MTKKTNNLLNFILTNDNRTDRKLIVKTRKGKTKIKKIKIQ